MQFLGHKQSGSSTIVAVIVMAIAGSVAATLYLQQENKIQLAAKERSLVTLRQNNLNALEVVSNALLSGKVGVKPKSKNPSIKPSDYTFATTTKSSIWSMKDNVFSVAGCNRYKSVAAKGDALTIECEDHSKVSTEVTLESINLTSKTAIVSATTVGKSGLARTDRAQLGVSATPCEEYLDPASLAEAKGFEATVTWPHNNHGNDGTSSTVWIYPFLYSGKFKGDDYEFNFHILWNWHRERLNGFTAGSGLAGFEKNHPRTTGTVKALTKSKEYTNGWDHVLESTCKHKKINKCAEWGIASANMECLDGKSCNRREVKATMVGAGIGQCDASNLILTTLSFTQRWGDGGGCFPITARIRMADDSYKYVGEIVTGDFVYNPITGGAKEVTKVVGGDEKKPLIKIISSEASITVTDGHPIKTPGGFIAAKDLQVGQEIYQDAERVVAITGIEEVPGTGETFVMNLEVDSDSDDPDQHALEVDGVVVGDLYLQRSLANGNK